MLFPHTYIHVQVHTHTHTQKGVRKFKELRLILVNSQIYIFFYSFCDNCCRNNWPYVRLNLFNHLLALFHAKFACNSAIRYPVFRWKLCKGFVWESMKNWLKVCIKEATRDWPPAKIKHMCGACRKLKGQDSWITIGQKVQSGLSIN